MKLDYVLGDATKPIGDDWQKKLIVHCCNDVGKWGAGFVLALSRKWKEPEAEYRHWYRSWKKPVPFKLGQIQLVNVEPNITVCNLIGQSGIGGFHELPPIRYGAIQEGLIRIRESLRTLEYPTIHMPKMGCDLAGGEWVLMQNIIRDVFSSVRAQIFVYNFAKS